MNAEDIKRACRSISGRISGEAELLTELDQKSGDGDLGISMREGFKAVSEACEASREQDLGKLLTVCSSVMNEAAPSSLGTILSFGMMGMAKPLRGKTDVSLAEWADAFGKGLELMMARAHSKPGEKTVLDALCPAAEALAAYADQPEKALRAALAAAETGCEATRGMRSVHGRAAYYGDASIGLLDGGAVVGRLIVEGMLLAWKQRG